MKNHKMSPSWEVSLAVEAVRNLENILRKISRKRKLTTEHRQKLLKYAGYLKRKRKAAGKGKVSLPKSCWVNILRCMWWMFKNGQHIKQIFVELVRGK